MIGLELRLAYSLAPGWLAPFVEALAGGRALARACRTCGHVSYPPVHACGCSSPEPFWTPLGGIAEILYRTEGTDGSFALVRFTGATTMAVVRLTGLTKEDAAGTLVASGDQCPALILGPVDQANQGHSK